MTKKPAIAVLVALLLATMVNSIAAAPAPTVTLANNGKTAFPIVVSENAKDEVRLAAQTLAAYLSEISGGTFIVKTGDGQQGIAVGMHNDFPRTGTGAALKPEVISRADDFLLRTHANGLYVIGTTPVSVRHAVWSLLYRFGHRQFFPGETWEVIPSEPTLRIAVDEVVHPDHPFAGMFHSFGTFWPKQNKEIHQWLERNRMINSHDWNFGHVYQELSREYPEIFKQHPEYWGLVDGKRASGKLCLSNAGLRKLFVERSLKWLKDHPKAVVVSAEPADGGGWCECAACQALGSPTDRALDMANEVARAVETAYSGRERYVGLLSYSHHSPPPKNIQAHPRVLVGFAQGFYSGQLIGKELVQAWLERGVKQFGTYHYLNVYQLNYDLPGRPASAALKRMAGKIKDYHNRGAVYCYGESTDSWGPAGLGMYAVSRFAWDVDQDVDALVDDFLTRCFGDAKVPMTRFYDLINGDNAPLVSADLVGRMYRTLNEARQQTKDPRVRARIRDLILWSHYVELFRAYKPAQGQERQAAFERMVRHAYRMGKTHMMASRPAYYFFDTNIGGGGIDRKIKVPAEAFWEIKEEKNPWKSSNPFTSGEIDTIVKRGILRNPIHDIEPVTFSTKLVPADRLEFPRYKPRGRLCAYFGGVLKAYVWIEENQQTLKFKVRAGAIESLRDRGDMILKLYRLDKNGEPVGKPVDQVSVSPTGQWQDEITLRTPHTGLHLLMTGDRVYGEVLWEPGTRVTIKESFTYSLNSSGLAAVYFFVPTGTKYVSGYNGDDCQELRDGDGNIVHKFPKLPGYFKVKVPEGQDGKVWNYKAGRMRILMTVPPYMALSPNELLLPAEVVEAELAHRKQRK